ncbi:MAG: polysaccharide biosynthesis tyrosine autokinase [Nitrospirota bacterium]
MDNKYELKQFEPKDSSISTYIEYLQNKDKEEFHLRDYLNIILKRKSMVLIFLVSVIVITLIFSLLKIPFYRATAVLKIESETPRVLSFQGVQIDALGANYYQTQYEILKSRSLAGRVIANLELQKNENFLPPADIPTRLKRFIFDNTVGLFVDFYRFLTAPKPEKEPQANSNTSEGLYEIPDYMIDSLISRIVVAPVKNSQLVKVSFISQNPELSMDVTNAVAQTYITFDLETRIYASKEAKNFLQSQIEVMKQKVEESEQTLNAYAAKNGIVFNSNNNNLYSQKLSDISAALNSVTTERIQKEALYREVKDSGPNNPIILNNPMIQGLWKQHASLEAEYDNLLKIYTPEYPKMKSLKNQMDSVVNRISQETTKIIQSAELDYKNALKKEENLTRALNSQKQQVLSFQGSAAQYEVLKRDVDVNKGLYNSLLQRLNEVSVSASNKATNIQLLDKAILPKYPFQPNIPFNIILSIIFGLAGGVGLAFLAEYFDSSIKDTDDIERKARLPILGVIPDVYDVKHVSVSSRPKIIHLESNPPTSHTPVVVNNKKVSPVLEAFRSIGAFILLSSSSKPPKTMLITGPDAKVGKTSTCINIANALLESLGKGIIIDADMRRPMLHSAFGLDNSVGLSSFLAGHVDFDSADNGLIKPSSMRGLSVLTSGPVPPNPSELIGSTRMQDLIYALQPFFEFVLIDSPPVMGLPDAIYLSKIVDGTVLVVKANETPIKVLQETKKVFTGIDARILGVVLNGVKESDLKYGSYNYYHSAYYSSYFGDKEK